MYSSGVPGSLTLRVPEMYDPTNVYYTDCRQNKPPAVLTSLFPVCRDPGWPAQLILYRKSWRLAFKIDGMTTHSRAHAYTRYGVVELLPTPCVNNFIAPFFYYLLQTCEIGSRCPFTQGLHTLNLDLRICQEAFGIEAKHVRKQISYTNLYYGGRKPRYDRTRGQAHPTLLLLL